MYRVQNFFFVSVKGPLSVGAEVFPVWSLKTVAECCGSPCSNNNLSGKWGPSQVSCLMIISLVWPENICFSTAVVNQVKKSGKDA